MPGFSRLGGPGRCRTFLVWVGRRGARVLHPGGRAGVVPNLPPPGWAKVAPHPYIRPGGPKRCRPHVWVGQTGADFPPSSGRAKVVPNPPVWVGQSDAELFSLGWAKVVPNFLRLGEPKWCRTCLAGHLFGTLFFDLVLAVRIMGAELIFLKLMFSPRFFGTASLWEHARHYSLGPEALSRDQFGALALDMRLE